MADGALIIGRLHKLYIEPVSDLEAPTWVEYGEIQGATRTQQRDVAEVKERNFLETTVELGHLNTEVTLQISRRPGLTTTFDVLEAAARSGDNVGIAMMTGGITEPGERGYQAEMKVVGFDDDQAHDSTMVSVTLRAAASRDTDPAYVEIAAPPP